MKLTREQLYEVMLALLHGMSAAAWEGVSPRPWWEHSDEEKASILAAVRSANEKLILDLNLDPEAVRFNQLFLNRMTLASVKNEERQQQEQREKWLTASAPRRGSTSGLRQAINDLLSQSTFFDAGQRLAVERRLAARKLPTLAMLEALLRQQHEKILKRGRIRNAVEYYLVQEILNFVEFPIDEASRQQLARFASEFEAKGAG